MLAQIRPVLYADDSPDDRFLMKEAWKEAGVANPLETVDDGSAAIDYLQKAAEIGVRKALIPGMLLLDIKMALMSGLETLEKIRAIDRWKTLPVVMYSASMAPGDVTRAYALGANDFLVKPSSLEELVELVRSINVFWLKYSEFPPQLEG